jgi:hypothetical protein
MILFYLAYNDDLVRISSLSLLILLIPNCIICEYFHKLKFLQNLLSINVLINLNFYKLYRVHTRYSHEMYKNCLDMSRHKSNKFLVISCVFGFLLQMNIHVRPWLYTNDFFAKYFILWLAKTYTLLILKLIQI